MPCYGSTPLAYGTTVRYDSDGKTEAKLTCGKGHGFRVFVGEPSHWSTKVATRQGVPLGRASHATLWPSVQDEPEWPALGYRGPPTSREATIHALACRRSGLRVDEAQQGVEYFSGDFKGTIAAGLVLVPLPLRRWRTCKPLALE